MNILSIETSCDETAIAILKCSGGLDSPQFNILGNTLLSQAQKHAQYGGVYPSLAKREHSHNLIPILTETLKEADFENVQPQKIDPEHLEKVGVILEREQALLKQFIEYILTIQKPAIDAIAVTKGPGLAPALWVGVNFARALSLVWDIPLIPVNHMEGHILSVLPQTDTIEFPALALLISGGHTQLVLVKDWLTYEILGETRDDAVGEAFDKVARIIDLPYPGGPEIGRLAAAEREAHPEPTQDYSFPRPMIHDDSYDFSFSGLKTAFLYTAQKIDTTSDAVKQRLAREFEDAVIDVLTQKTKRALESYGAKTLIIGGGVIASQAIRSAFTKLIEDYPDIELQIPDMSLTTDNAVMIGITGYLHFLKEGPAAYVQAENLDADGNLRL